MPTPSESSRRLPRTCSDWRSGCAHAGSRRWRGNPRACTGFRSTGSSRQLVFAVLRQKPARRCGRAPSRMSQDLIAQRIAMGWQAWRSDVACVRSQIRCLRCATRSRRTHVRRRVNRNGGASRRLPGMRPPHLRYALHASRRRRVFRQREMSSRFVIIGEIRGQDTSEVPLAEYDHMVQTLPPDGSDQPFRVGTLPRAGWARVDLTNVHAGRLAVGTRRHRSHRDLSTATVVRCRPDRLQISCCPAQVAVGCSVTLVTLTWTICWR
jgi:hypothetical protein